MPADDPLLVAPLESLTRWLKCLGQGRDEGKPGHDFDDDGACTRCTAKRGDPTLADILAQQKP